MDEEQIIRAVLHESLNIHKTIGPGLLENVYKTCLAYKLQQGGLKVEIEKPVPVIFEEIKMECGYRADLVVENLVVIEIKRVDAIADVHIAQILTYLRCLNLRYGLILNFNTALLKDGIRRVLNGYESKSTNALAR